MLGEKYKSQSLNFNFPDPRVITHIIPQYRTVSDILSSDVWIYTQALQAFQFRTKLC
jgi:hypothetical protein